MLIYQLLPRLFSNQGNNTINGAYSANGSGKLVHISPKALERIKDLGADTIWLTGVIDYATTTDYGTFGKPASHPDVVKGRAGSPYAIRNFFDIAPDLAIDPAKRLEEFQQLVARIHSAGLKVLIDFVPNHTARQYHTISQAQAVNQQSQINPAAGDVRQAGFHLDNFYTYLTKPFVVPKPTQGSWAYKENPAKVTGNSAYTHAPTEYDWYETAKINYGVDDQHTTLPEGKVPATWPFMTQVLQYWASQGVDGFRCDMVDMVPSAFWSFAIGQVRALHPAMLFIGESYMPGNYRALFSAGFSFLYDKVGLYDAVKEVLQGKAKADGISKALWDNKDIAGNLLHFMENHDEPRIAHPSMAGSADGGLAGSALQALATRGPWMHYMAQELGERATGAEGFSGADGKTTIFDYWSLTSLGRLNNQGAWELDMLKPAEKALYQRYRQLYGFKQNRKLFTDGDLYNLQPANPTGYGEAEEAKDKLFAFVRYLKGSEAALVVINLSDAATLATITLPKACKELAGLPGSEEQISLKLEPFDYTIKALL